MLQNKDKLFYYSASKDVPAGKGVKEIVANPSKYVKLNGHRGWRRVLSNFYEADFVFDDPTYGDGLTYRTVEHCFQAQKIALVNKELAYRFTVDSGDVVGRDNGNVARKNRKIVVLSGAELEMWYAIQDKVMKAANTCKYNQCPEFRTVLELTLDAELWHIVARSSQSLHTTYLEEIRSGSDMSEMVKHVVEPDFSLEKAKHVVEPVVYVESANIDRTKIIKSRGGYTVVQLKDFLRAFKLPVGGKKADLVDRLNNKLDNI